ncbi:hypothetical protein [Rhizobium sp. L245/93]|uniref:hypothetical protein n=1 Tax=Rhizobium sp. L245/93 TaxID=2819998 RepID=UPI001ADB4300|nr:hypothetical protein [Rhizobium sp. L245/93]MBO9170028.1 hypothetical protein [Rhizobium sp. L245/93]
MNGKTKVQLANLGSNLVEDAQRVLSELSIEGRVNVSFSPELAIIISKFLGVALEGGAVAFGSVAARDDAFA